MTTTVNIPEYLANVILRHFPGGLFYANEQFYKYNRGAWEQIEERAHVRHVLARFFGENASAEKINGALTLLKDFLVLPDTALNPNKNLICLSNGTLDTTTYQLLEHSSTHRLTNRTDIEWNPAATCPRWLQFMDEIFAFDADKEQKIAFLQEWMGYCLVPDTSQHKFVWMVGAGGNGKSVFLNILTKLVGEKNVSHAYMERLGEKCVRAELEGKLVNISSEMSAEAAIADGYLKAIVSGDLVEAERKYKPSFSFRPTVRLIAATNHLPRLLDHSDGFARRAVIIGFNRQFSEHEKDVRLETKLIAELPGILAWAVQGLINLQERTRFEIPESSLAALTQYRQESDPVALFASEKLEQVESGGLSTQDLYPLYQTWCRDFGHRHLSNVSFGKRLAALGFQKRRGSRFDYWLVELRSTDYIEGESTRVEDNVVLMTTLPATRTTALASRYRL